MSWVIALRVEQGAHLVIGIQSFKAVVVAGSERELRMIEDTSKVGSCGQHTDGDALPDDEKLIEGWWWRIVVRSMIQRLS